MDILAVRQHLADARDAIGDPTRMIGPDRADRILTAVDAADSELEHGSYEPEQGRALEWLDKLRAIIVNGWMPEEHGEGEAYGRALETFDRARADLVGPAVTQAPNDRHEPEHARPEYGPAGYDASGFVAAVVKVGELPEGPEYGSDNGPTIEVMRLPGDRFMLVLSNWPDPWTAGPGASSEVQRLRDETGAACVLAVSFPVFTLGGE